MTFENFHRALKRGRIEPAYYFTGPEEILKDEAIAALIEAAIDPAARDFNVDRRSAGDLDGETLHALIETPPMLAERRLVVVRGLEQWRKNAKIWKVLTAYLAQPSPTTVLVLTHGPEQKPDTAIAAATAHVAFEELKPAHVRRWITARGNERGLVVEPEAADHLAAATGGELALLARELDKLAAASTTDRVTAEDVAALVGVRRGETAHDWVDAVLARDVRRATALVETVLALAGVSAVQLLMLLGTALVGVRLARALLDAGSNPARLPSAVFQALKAARPAKLRPWGVESKTWSAAARHWSATELDRFLAAAYEADRQLKSTTIADPAGVLTALVLQAAPRAAA